MCLWDNKLVDVGSFNNPCQRVALWDGTSWSCAGGGVGLVGRDAIEWNGNLVVVGDFWNNFQPCTDCNGIGVWDGTSWTPLGTGFNNDVLCLAIWNGDLIAGGDFTEADGQPCSRIARWDGTTWQPIGGPTDFDNDIRCMIEYDGELWVGGDFNNVAGCSACDGLVKWDGTNWVGGDSGVDIQGGVDSTVRVLYVNPNDGNLYMGGHFTDLSIDGVTTAFNGVAMYDGSVWTPLGSGVNSYVRAIHEYNGNLIVGGDFNSASGTSANKIAKWNPNTSTWSAMGSGMNDYVKSATVYNGVFYAGGAFTSADGQPREYIASWYEVPSVPPVAGINSSTGSVCAGSCISFADFSTNTPTSWTWSFPGASVTSSNLQNPGSICYPNPGTYTVTLQACNGSGCDVETMNVTINSTPTVTVNNATICEGESATLTATPSSGGGTFAWSPGGATTSSITVNPTGSTSYSVVYTLNGCASISSAGNVAVNEVPSVTVSSSSSIICSGNSVTLTATPSVGGGTYSWSPGGASSTVINESPSTTTTYTVSYSLNGCDAPDANATITVNQTPSVSVNDETICDGTTVTLTAIPSAGGGTYLWNPGGQTNQSIDVNPSSSTNYSVVYTLNGCESTIATSDVTVIAQPTVDVNDETICSGNSVLLTASPSSGGGSFLWSPGGETTSSINVNPGSTSTFTVTYTVNGCADATDISTVIVNETPTVSVNNETLCAGESTALSALPSVIGGTYLWSPGGETSANILVSPSSTSSYSVVYTLNGCSSAAAMGTVTVNPMPDITVTENNFVLSSNQTGAAYQWLDCENMSEITGETSANFNPAGDGDYAVVITLNGCVDTSACSTIYGMQIKNIESGLLTIYPNPFHDSFSVELNGDMIGQTMIISDASGKVVAQIIVSNAHFIVSAENFSPGVYYASVQNSGLTIRLIKL